jgi:tryptophan synthase beta chain
MVTVVSPETSKVHKVYLEEADIPQRWHNTAVDLNVEMPPHLDSVEDRPAEVEDYDWLWPRECLKIELRQDQYGRDSWIDIPEPVLAAYRRYRPSPLVRARGLEEHLGTRHEIYYKREDLNPGGSHKFNTALAQAYYAAQQGVRTLVTDTGAGQWGTALALACVAFDLELKVFMVRKSFEEKPYRRHLMQLLGADVYASPSSVTATGREVLAADPDSSGSLGIGMAEAIELVRDLPDHRLALGCMSYYAAMHQTVIGLETQKQLEKVGRRADVLVGCVGGGSNLTGFVSPFLAGPDPAPLCIAAEPDTVPTLTKGEFRYDWADYGRHTPRIPMYTLGSDFLPPPIHSGGLRYHGKTPILSALVKNGMIEPRAFAQQDVFTAGQLFLKTEGVLPAPESSHAIVAAIREAQNPARVDPCTIVICLSGHGYLDLQGYSDVLALA